MRVDSEGRFRLQLYILLLGVMLMGAKFAAYFITSSNAIFTDALESIVNVVAGAFGLYSLWLAAQPMDKDHPYGHGKIEFISAGFEGGLIFLAGVAMMSKAAFGFFHPAVIQHIDIGIYLSAGAGLMNFLGGYMLERKGKRTRSLIMIASGKHLKSDAYSSAAMVLGLILMYFTREYWLDNVIALIFGVFIAWMGLRLVRRSVGGVMDEADMELLELLVQTLDTHRRAQWIDLHNMRVIKYGDRIHVDCHVTLPRYFDLEASHAEIEAIEQIVNRESGMQVEFFIHSDPCVPYSCGVCGVNNCPVRNETQKTRVTWTIENAMENRKHTKATSPATPIVSDIE